MIKTVSSTVERSGTKAVAIKTLPAATDRAQPAEAKQRGRAGRGHD